MNLVAPLLLFASLASVNEGQGLSNTTSSAANITEQTWNVTNSTVKIGTLLRRNSVFKGALNCTLTSDSTQSYSLQVTGGESVFKVTLPIFVIKVSVLCMSQLFVLKSKSSCFSAIHLVAILLILSIVVKLMKIAAYFYFQTKQQRRHGRP